MLKSRECRSRILTALGLCATGTTFAQPTFTVIPPLLGKLSAKAWAISGDGLTAVGTSEAIAVYPNAFRWNALTGLQDIGLKPGDTFASAYGVNADGSVVVGMSGAYTIHGHTAFRWTAETGIVSLGSLSNGGPPYFSEAFDVSADGAVVVGLSNSDFGSHAFRWTRETGMIDLGVFPEGSYSYANAVSADGSTVVGGGDVSNSLGQAAWRWTQRTGLQPLGQSPSGEALNALAVNSDGSIVVGSISKVGPSRAFKWTAQSGVVELDILPGGGTTAAYDVNADGSVIVGFGQSAAYDQWAMLWSSALGTIDLRTGLAPYGLDLSDWYSLRPTTVSSDGTTVGGWGSKPGGVLPQAWILTGLPLSTQTCGADCDESRSLDIDDFICFQTRFAVGDLAADCDSSGGLTLDDFICFQTLYALGC